MWRRGGALGKPQPFHHRVREALGLVGDNAPPYIFILQSVEQFGHALKHAAVHTNGGLIIAQKFFAHGFKFWFTHKIVVNTIFFTNARLACRDRY